LGAINRNVFAKSSRASATALKLPRYGKAHGFSLPATRCHFDAVASKIVVLQQVQIASGGESLHEVLVPPHLRDFVQVDQRLDGLALGIVVGKLAPVR
jgi:hypothetical protein